jgi:hypothetical protein
LAAGNRRRLSTDLLPFAHRVNQLTRENMTKYRLEYIWLDGYTPVPNLRGKTQIKEFSSFPSLA